MFRDYEYLREEREAIDIFNYWLDRLAVIERLTTHTSPSEPFIFNCLDICFLLFPLLDSISSTLFGGTDSGQTYLKELGYTKNEAKIFTTCFRHGQLHALTNYHLVYDDAEVSWDMGSSGGTSGFLPFNRGYFSADYPQLSVPAEKPFKYTALGAGKYRASLQLDRLAAQVRDDLFARRDLLESDAKVTVIIGQRMNGKKCPKPPSGKSE
jgi:hypothetical protein